MIDDPVSEPEVSVCALAECQVEVQQPARGGRRRLYCSDAHRAEAGRRRQAGTAPAPVDVLDSLLGQLEGVLGGLRRQHDQLRSIDPARQASDAARLRAEATTEVLAAQQAAATASEDAARIGERLAAERAEWDEKCRRLRQDLDEARSTTTTSEERANQAEAALAIAVATHRGDVDDRERAAAKAASDHESEIGRLAGEVERAHTAVAAADARAAAADHRAAKAEDQARAATRRVDDAEREAAQRGTRASTAEQAASTATARAEAAERALEAVRVELSAERTHHNAIVAQLAEQLRTLVAAVPTVAVATKTPSRRRPAKSGSGGSALTTPNEPPSAARPNPTAPPAPGGASPRRRSAGMSR